MIQPQEPIRIHTVLLFRPSEACDYSAYNHIALYQAAYPNAPALSSTLSGFTLQTDIHLGARFDKSSGRHFKGRMASIIISSTTYSQTQVMCLFKVGYSLTCSPKN